METIAPEKPAAQGRAKFIIGGLLILAAVIYLIVSSTQENSQYFLTVEELLERSDEMVGLDVRISGAVLGDTVDYDSQNLDLAFTIAHIPGDNKDIDAQGGIALVLHNATQDPNLPSIRVKYNGVMPDLLQNEAQAIVTGTMDENNVFHASELLLKCPTKYEDEVPGQVVEEG
jgi:cytochrome c-type biogenesis protein CcmE